MHGVIENYRYFAKKRYSTLAGTLVYFLIMSVTPFLFWLALLVGNVDFSRLMAHDLFSAVEPVLTYLQNSAAEATGSAGIILILTSLWSSTNFFYHLRRSGEIIYECSQIKGGFGLRLQSLLAVFVSLILIAMGAAIPFFGYGVLQNIMPNVIAEIISMIFITMIAFFVAYLLNVFACPYRLRFENAAGGALLTVILWLLFAVGFSFYLLYANPQKLYGAIAAIIIFLLWCYLMVNSLVIGIIYNSRYSCAEMRIGAYEKIPPVTGGTLS